MKLSNINLQVPERENCGSNYPTISKTLSNLLRLAGFAFLLLVLGCPVLTTLETAKIGNKSDDPNILRVGDFKQADFGATVVSETLDTAGPIRLKSVVPLIEGKIKWVLINERFEVALNGGSSGLGLSSKVLMIKNPFYLACKLGVSGFPTVVAPYPLGCYALDFILSKDLKKTSEFYGGFKLTSWFDIPPPPTVLINIPSHSTSSDPYFDAAGAFLGLKSRFCTVEAGACGVFRELENYWGRKGIIPFVGVSVPLGD